MDESNQQFVGSPHQGVNPPLVNTPDVYQQPWAPVGYPQDITPPNPVGYPAPVAPGTPYPGQALPTYPQPSPAPAPPTPVPPVVPKVQPPIVPTTLPRVVEPPKPQVTPLPQQKLKTTWRSRHKITTVLFALIGAAIVAYVYYWFLQGELVSEIAGLKDKAIDIFHRFKN